MWKKQGQINNHSYGAREWNPLVQSLSLQEIQWSAAIWHNRANALSPTKRSAWFFEAKKGCHHNPPTKHKGRKPCQRRDNTLLYVLPFKMARSSTLVVIYLVFNYWEQPCTIRSKCKPSNAHPPCCPAWRLAHWVALAAQVSSVLYFRD